MSDSKQVKQAANPGSDEAIAQGCRCPVLDNAHGRGYMGGAKDENGNTIFVTSSDCSLHWLQHGEESV